MTFTTTGMNVEQVSVPNCCTRKATSPVFCHYVQVASYTTLKRTYQRDLAAQLVEREQPQGQDKADCDARVQQRSG